MFILTAFLDTIATIGTVLLIPVGIILLLRLVFAPLKWGIKLLINLVCGFVLLIVLNLFGGFAGVSVPISFVTCAVTGIFGIPGALGCLAWAMFEV